jgi:putative flippase GtrA
MTHIATPLQFPLTQSKSEIRRFLQFATVGGLSTALDFAVLFLLKAVGLPTAAANTLSYSAGIILNFNLNRRWTYAASRTKRLTTQFLQFAAISLAGLVLNSALVIVLAAPLGAHFNLPTQGTLIAKVLATGASLCWNFAANRLWTFNDIQAQEGADHVR